MRSTTLAGLALALALGGCAAPTSDDTGEASGAASVEVAADTTLSDAEAAALRGEGLSECEGQVGEATVCVAGDSVAVMTEDGIALLSTKGDVINVKALAKGPQRNDVGEVMAAVDDAQSGTSTASLRPLGWQQMAMKPVLEMIGNALAKLSTRRAAALPITGGESVALKNATLAGDLREFSKVLGAGQGAKLAAEGHTVLMGSTNALAGENFRRWLAVTDRRALGVVGIPGTKLGEGSAAVERFFETYVRKIAADSRARGQKVIVMIPDVLGYVRLDFVAKAKREGVEIGLMSSKAGTAFMMEGDAKVLIQVGAGVPQMPKDVAAFADDVFKVTNDGVEVLATR